MIVANSSPKADPVPAGTYAARCFSMVHLGTRTENILGVDKELNKVRIGWELPTELKVFKEENGEQPYSVSKEFTLSMHEKANLRKFLESWRGKGFTDDEAKALDITALLGKPCMLSVIHKTTKQGNTYAEISSVSALPKGMTCPDLINPITEFTFTPFDQETFNKLPDWLKDKIKSSKEYREIRDNSKDEDEPPF
ncbi:MAG: hypothetical protein UR73_C0037G0008 [candidate division WS6 bacterium GW2011_GWF1_35_23]|uniref:Uncharacterized protein n=1 Tax=candidate division WS6 bacterium GW2011_GWF1_35_23 TaxID=1619097 RepID=A0A0G0BZ97_9BACT|nr:MAG: hypothetical protein UR73_C0037G0008 [candidate division WS6 bacterium GW2011_GWF1_35_23]